MFLERELKKYAELGARHGAAVSPLGGALAAAPSVQSTQSTQSTPPIALGPFRFVDLLNTWDLQESTPLYLLVSDGERRAVAVAARSVYEPFRQQIDPAFDTHRLVLVRHMGFVPWKRELIPHELAEFTAAVNGCEAVLKVSAMQLRGSAWLRRTTGPRPPRPDELGPLPAKQRSSPFMLPLTFEAERPQQFAPVDYSDDSLGSLIGDEVAAEEPAPNGTGPETVASRENSPPRDNNDNDDDDAHDDAQIMSEIVYGSQANPEVDVSDPEMRARLQFESDPNMAALISYGAQAGVDYDSQQPVERPEVLSQAPSQPFSEEVDLTGSPSAEEEALQASPEPEELSSPSSSDEDVPQSQAVVESPGDDDVPQSQAAVESPSDDDVPQSQAAVESPSDEGMRQSQVPVESPSDEDVPQSQAPVESPRDAGVPLSQASVEIGAPSSAGQAAQHDEPETWSFRTATPVDSNEAGAWTEAEERALTFGIVYAHGPHWAKVRELYGAHGTIGDDLQGKTLRQLRHKASALKYELTRDGKKLPPGFEAVPLFPDSDDSESEPDSGWRANRESHSPELPRAFDSPPLSSDGSELESSPEWLATSPDVSSIMSSDPEPESQPAAEQALAGAEPDVPSSPSEDADVGPQRKRHKKGAESDVPSSSREDADMGPRRKRHKKGPEPEHLLSVVSDSELEVADSELEVAESDSSALSQAAITSSPSPSPSPLPLPSPLPSRSRSPSASAAVQRSLSSRQRLQPSSQLPALLLPGDTTSLSRIVSSSQSADSGSPVQPAGSPAQPAVPRREPNIINSQDEPQRPEPEPAARPEREPGAVRESQSSPNRSCKFM